MATDSAADDDAARAPTLTATPAIAGERLAAGVRAGEYVVERFLGAGAMGEVYAGRHPLIGKRVAIKVLRRELAADAEAADRFLREARAAGQLDHPNVVDVFGFGRVDDGRLYLVMDFVDGESLRARLAAGALPVREALELLAQVADALDAAHLRGVVHRDLKPDNIVLAGATPKVLDFGLAKLVSRSAGDVVATLTARGTWLGTPAYMAPEQWSADGATVASDRYALGVIAFELLAGRLPFDAANVPQMMEQHFRTAVPSLTARGGATTAYDAVLARAMAKDPDARFATARAMVEALRAASGVAAADVPAASARGLRAYLPAIAAVGVLGAGLAVVAWGRGGDGDEAPSAAPAPAMAAETHPTPTPARPRVHVVADPAGAHVLAGGHDLGMTPVDIDLDDHAVAATVHKPGYADAPLVLPAAGSADVAAPVAVAVTLAPIAGFEGVWRLPTGELRAFEREHAAGGDAVAVSKLDSVHGRRTFFRRYELADVPTGADLGFAAIEETAAPRPDDPDCRIPLRVEYRYRVDGDALELRRERVALDEVAGHCVARDSKPGEPERLVRVDRALGDPTWVAPPAGMPSAKSNRPTRNAMVKAKPPAANDDIFTKDNVNATKDGVHATANAITPGSGPAPQPASQGSPQAGEPPPQQQQASPPTPQRVVEPPRQQKLQKPSPTQQEDQNQQAAPPPQPKS